MTAPKKKPKKAKPTTKRVPKLEDLCGVFAGHADIDELKKEIDKMREEY